MSSFGSSVINKSGKKITPKAPTQRSRTAAVAPSRPTAGSSSQVEPGRQEEAATPPQATQLIPETQHALDAIAQGEGSSSSTSLSTVAPSAVLGDEPTTSIDATTATNITDATTREPPTKRRRAEFAERVISTEGPSSSTEASPSLLPAGAGENEALEATLEAARHGSERGGDTQAADSLEDPAVEGSPSQDGATESAATSHRSPVTNSNTQSLVTSSADNNQHATIVPTPRDVLRANLAALDDSLEQVAPVAIMGLTSSAISKDVTACNTLDQSAKKRTRAQKTTADKDTAPKPSRTRKKRTDIIREGTDSSDQPAKKRRRKRDPTPEDAEDIEIDPETLTMFELARASKRSSKGGKTSKLERAMENINWEEVTQKRKEKEAHERAAGAKASQGEVNDRLNPADDNTQRGPRLKLVNGQMVIDNSSLFVNRHGDAPEGADLEELEEDDLTARINSQSWLYDNKKEPEERFRSTHKSDPWSQEDTDKFYDALSMWGTDFQIMAAMFPGKTRRHIKLKFVREERANPDRVNSALIHDVVPMNLETFCAATGEDAEFYKDPDVFNEELRIEEEQQREEIQKQKEDMAEAQRQKQEAATAKLGKKRTRRPLNPNSGGAGGEEVEVNLADLGDIPG